MSKNGNVSLEQIQIALERLKDGNDSLMDAFRSSPADSDDVREIAERVARYVMELDEKLEEAKDKHTENFNMTVHGIVSSSHLNGLMIDGYFKAKPEMAADAWKSVVSDREQTVRKIQDRIEEVLTFIGNSKKKKK